MRLVQFIFSTVLVLLATTFAAAAPAKSISPVEAYRLLQSNPDVFLLDVRTSQEYLQMRLANARLIPVDQLARRIGEVPRDRPVVVYCAVGSRSSKMAEYLARIGYSNVYNMYGGIYAWQGRGYPVLQGPP